MDRRGNKSPDTYTGSARFESPSGYRIYSQFFSLDFPLSLQANIGTVFRLNHDHFLPSPFQIIVRIATTLFILSIESVVKRDKNKKNETIFCHISVLPVWSAHLFYAQQYSKTLVTLSVLGPNKISGRHLLLSDTPNIYIYVRRKKYWNVLFKRDNFLTFNETESNPDKKKCKTNYQLSD